MSTSASPPDAEKTTVPITSPMAKVNRIEIYSVNDYQYIEIINNNIPFISNDTIIISIVDDQDNLLYENNFINDDFKGFNNEVEILDLTIKKLTEEGLDYIDVDYLPYWINFVRQFAISNIKIVYATIYIIKYLYNNYTPYEILESAKNNYKLTQQEQGVIDSYIKSFISNDSYNDYMKKNNKNPIKLLKLDLTDPNSIGIYKK